MAHDLSCSDPAIPDPITQIISFPSFWVTPSYCGIQVSEFVKTSEAEFPATSFPYAGYVEVNGLVIRYLFSIAKENRSLPATRYNALHLLQHCISRNPEDEDVQLTALVCLLVSSKFHDKHPLSIATLSKKSLGHYSTPQFLAREQAVLKMLDYNVNRPEFLYDKIALYLSMTCPLIPPGNMRQFHELCTDLCDLLHEYPLGKFLKKYSVGLLAAGVIQTALMVATKSEGKLPATARLATIIGRADSQIRQLAKKMLKYALGKDMYAKYDL